MNLFITTFMCGGLLIFLGVTARLVLNYMEYNYRTAGQALKKRKVHITKNTQKASLSYMTVDPKLVNEQSRIRR